MKGYNLLEEAICVTVSPDGITKAEIYRIPNTRGAILPETVGIGTTMLLTVGGGMTLVAIVLWVTRKRMQTFDAAD